MRTDTVSSLRQRMIEDMNARKLGSHTQRSHISSCKRFAAFLTRSPDTATAEDIRRFQLHLSVSVQEQIESIGSFVIQERWPDSRRVTDVDDEEPWAIRP